MRRKIFILEDDPERHKVFRGHLSQHDLTIEDNVWDAKKSFTEDSDYDLILLDHDLGGEQLVNSEEANTGYSFVKWAAEFTHLGNYKIIVHSLNPVGANRMMKFIPDGMHIPFYNLIPTLKAIK